MHTSCFILHIVACLESECLLIFIQVKIFNYNLTRKFYSLISIWNIWNNTGDILQDRKDKKQEKEKEERFEALAQKKRNHLRKLYTLCVYSIDMMG